MAKKAEAAKGQVPPFTVQPPPASRNFDPTPPDCPPLPPDDPAAHVYMHCVDGKKGYAHWHKNGDSPVIEFPHWLAALRRNEDGEMPLDREAAVELGLLHSREYQFELEELYLSALALTFERFEFDVQWFGGNTTFYEHFGSGGEPLEQNTLSTTSNLGFSRAFSTGGQLLVDFANTMVWEFTGDDSHLSFSNLSISLIQPLLRGAFRDVRLEPLTQAERNVLYAVRGFARFRKTFYFNIVSGDGGYLSLLLQLQAIRNLESNLESLRRNLLAHEALAEAGIVSPLQVDQVFQQYQTGRLRLIQAENDFQTALDIYKTQLGLPPELEVELDDSLLAPFELNSPEVARLEEEIERLLAEFRELDEAPSRERLQQGLRELIELNESLLEEWDAVAAELERWRERPIEVDDPEQRERQAELRTTLGRRMEELRRDVQESGRDVQRAMEALEGAPLAAGWENIQLLARRLSAHAADLFVVQTQVRAYLIELPDVDLEQERAVFYALDNRLDLRNVQAQVVDAWRKIRVAADALEADLDVFLDADIATAPGSDNPFAFSSAASRYRVGVAFDAPLNRLAERNIYRSELIQYQRARRDYIGLRDTVVRRVRLDLRQLAADRLNFEIARQSLITAARQVELARVQLLAPAAGQASDSSNTQDVLNALNSLLDAKNNLVAIWIAYETGRLQLLLDTEALQLDARGMAFEDECDPDDQDGPAESEPDVPAGDVQFKPAGGTAAAGGAFRR